MTYYENQHSKIIACLEFRLGKNSPPSHSSQNLRNERICWIKNKKELFVCCSCHLDTNKLDENHLSELITFHFRCFVGGLMLPKMHNNHYSAWLAWRADSTSYLIWGPISPYDSHCIVVRWSIMGPAVLVWTYLLEKKNRRRKENDMTFLFIIFLVVKVKRKSLAYNLKRERQKSTFQSHL